MDGNSLMDWVVLLVVGGVIGWLASIVMRTNAQQGLLLNIVVGIVGSLLGGFLLASVLPGGILTLYGFLRALIGAIVLLGIVNLVRRGSVR